MDWDRSRLRPPVGHPILPNATYSSRCRAPAFIVGPSLWTAADAPVGLFAPCRMPIPLFRLRDGGVPRRPRGLPHNFSSLPDIGKNKWRCPTLPQ